MHPDRSRGVLGPILCEARPQHLPHPGETESSYTMNAVHDIEAGPEGFALWLQEEAPRVIPKSPMGVAFTYAQLQWQALRRYTTDGDLGIDNNAAERELRRVAIGRKNWLFAGSDEGGRRAAVLYSLLASARLHGLDPFAYLRDLFERLPTHPRNAVAELTPAAWAQALKPPARAAA